MVSVNAKEEMQTSDPPSTGPGLSVFPRVRSTATNMLLKSRAAAVLMIMDEIAEP
jgi:hypothetical protein